jgi:hypothetical protein
VVGPGAWLLHQCPSLAAAAGPAQHALPQSWGQTCSSSSSSIITTRRTSGEQTPSNSDAGDVPRHTQRMVCPVQPRCTTA